MHEIQGCFVTDATGGQKSLVDATELARFSSHTASLFVWPPRGALHTYRLIFVTGLLSATLWTLQYCHCLFSEPP